MIVFCGPKKNRLNETRKKRKTLKKKRVCLLCSACLAPASCDAANGTRGRHDVDRRRWSWRRRRCQWRRLCDCFTLTYLLHFAFCCFAGQRDITVLSQESVFTCHTHTHTQSLAHTLGDVRRHCCIWRALDLQMRRKLCNWPWKQLCCCALVCVHSVCLCGRPVGDSWQIHTHTHTRV